MKEAGVDNIDKKLVLGNHINSIHTEFVFLIVTFIRNYFISYRYRIRIALTTGEKHESCSNTAITI